MSTTQSNLPYPTIHSKHIAKMSVIRQRTDSIVSEHGEPATAGWPAVMAEALVYALEADDVDVVKAAEADALALPTPSGNYALHVACEHGAMRVVRHLVAAREHDVDIRDAEQWTPLHYAATFQASKAELAHYLLSHGADAGAEDSDGDTPLAAHMDDADETDAGEALTRSLLASVEAAAAYEPWARDHARDATFEDLIARERPTYAAASARLAFCVLQRNAVTRQENLEPLSPEAFLLGAHGGQAAFDHLLAFLG